NAVVFRFVEAAARPAAGEEPGLPPCLPKRGEDYIGIVRIEDDINPTGVLVFRENLCPRFSTVAGSKNSALLIRAESVAERGDQTHIGVGLMNDERSDLAGIAQPDIFPVLSRVHRFVNTGAVSCISANRGLAGADVDGVVIRRRHRNCTNRGDVLLIEERRPIRSAVHCFPNPARHGAEVPDLWFTQHPFDRKCASATEWSDLPPLHPGKKLWVILWSGSGRRRSVNCPG